MPMMRRGVRRAVVGTAAVSHVAKKSAQAGAAQAQQAAAQAQPAPVAAAPSATDPMDAKVEQLTKLAELNKAGILSDEEFAAEKAKILAS